jgi:hypothetical protein
MTTPATINCHWTVRPYRKAIPDSNGQTMKLKQDDAVTRLRIT